MPDPDAKCKVTTAACATVVSAASIESVSPFCAIPALLCCAYGVITGQKYKQDQRDERDLYRHQKSINNSEHRPVHHNSNMNYGTTTPIMK
ncbi:MAG: hypothetical protein WC748_02950 [Legionellales bacterium]